MRTHLIADNYPFHIRRLTIRNVYEDSWNIWFHSLFVNDYYHFSPISHSFNSITMHGNVLISAFITHFVNDKEPLVEDFSYRFFEYLNGPTEKTAEYESNASTPFRSVVRQLTATLIQTFQYSNFRTRQLRSSTQNSLQWNETHTHKE